MKINSNIPALKVLNQMNKTNSYLDIALQRLSSGKKINRAADDAAGLAISQKMKTQITGLGVAKRNSEDGICLIQTAEGALGEVHSMVQRARELSVQASNGTLADEDRNAIQAEIDNLLEEIDRVSQEIDYNGMILLDGSIDVKSYSSNNNIASVISTSDGVKPGQYKFTVVSNSTSTIATGVSIPNTTFDSNNKITVSGNISVNGMNIRIEEGQTGDEVFALIRETAQRSGVSLSNTQTTLQNGSILTFTNDIAGESELLILGDSRVLNALGLNSADITLVDGRNAQVTIDQYDNPATSTIEGFPAGTTVITDGNRIKFTALNGFEMIVENSNSAGSVVLDIVQAGALDLQIGANNGQKLTVRIPNMSVKALNLENINLQTTKTSEKAIELFDQAISKISEVRSKLGAFQNRLEHTVSSLETSSENLTSSLSRIEDSDMAEEMANYTRYNVLAQASMSVLAQANQRPEAILQLINK